MNATGCTHKGSAEWLTDRAKLPRDLAPLLRGWERFSFLYRKGTGYFVTNRHVALRTRPRKTSVTQTHPVRRYRVATKILASRLPGVRCVWLDGTAIDRRYFDLVEKAFGADLKWRIHPGDSWAEALAYTRTGRLVAVVAPLATGDLAPRGRPMRRAEVQP